MVGTAAEFAVASELGRRNVYAQPTFGHLKRTDLLIIIDSQTAATHPAASCGACKAAPHKDGNRLGDQCINP